MHRVKESTTAPWTETMEEEVVMRVVEIAVTLSHPRQAVGGFSGVEKNAYFGGFVKR